MHPFTALQSVLPQHGLSRCLGFVAAWESKWPKRALINAFMAAYRVDLSEFEGDGADDYASFNDFFTRPLLPGSRPLSDDPTVIVSPADGTVSQTGVLRGDRLLQAKGREYTLAELLGDARLAGTLAGGSFVTIYLAPHNYHRVHAPCDAGLVSSVEIPGRLFSVNSVTERHVPRLFARNERLVLRLRASFGEFALVLVGAMIVASIRVPWPGPVSPYRRRVTRSGNGVSFGRGAEVGAFLLGSTVIAVFPPDRVGLAEHLAPGTDVRVGGTIGTVSQEVV